MMELKAGYKQTEVGVIPEDWEAKQLGDVIEKFVGGGTPSRSISDYWGDDIPWVTVKDFATFNPRQSQEAITRTGLHNSASHLVPKGTLITSTRMALGKSVVYEVDVAINQDLKALFPKPVLKTQFLHYWFQYHGKSIDELGSGSTVKGISLPDLKKIEFLLPQRHEQEAIAGALSDTDALIESLEQLITKKRHIKQGAMQELLTGKKRLAKYQVKHGYKQTDLGVIPEDWDIVPMGQISECLVGLTYSPFDVRDFGTLVLRSSNIQNGRLAFNDNVFVDMQIPTRAITRENDILICVRNGSRQLIGKCALIDDKTAGCAFGAFMSVLRSDSAKFLFFQFQSNILKRQIDEVMGATINQITNKDMAAFKVIWPPTKAEQTAIAAILSDMDAEIAALESRLAKTRALKQGMMHNLLTGRIRLL